MPDVVIVGGGIIGSSIALALKTRGIQPVLLEKAVVGAESSSAAAGMLTPQMEHDAPTPAFELGIASRDIYSQFVGSVREDSGLDVGYLRDGGLLAFENETERDAAYARRAWQRSRGLKMATVDRAELATRIPGVSASVTSGIYFPDEAQIDPPRLMRALSTAVRRRGIECRTGCAVRRIVVDQGRAIGIELDDGIVSAAHTVIAAGAWSSTIPGASLPRQAVRPARGQMLVVDAKTRPFTPHVWAKDCYLVPRSDGRLLVGATVEHVGFQKAVTAGGINKLLTGLLATLPELAQAPILKTWSGLRPFTPSDAPLIGPALHEGLLFATGHYRNGILQAPITAEVIADLIEGRAPRVDPAPFGIE